MLTYVDGESSRAADQAQGWAVARRGSCEDRTECVEIRRAAAGGAEECRFAGDEGAPRSAETQARTGSALHCAALDLRVSAG